MHRNIDHYFLITVGGLSLINDSPAIIQGTFHSSPPSLGDTLTLINGPVAFHPQGDTNTIITLDEASVVFSTTLSIQQQGSNVVVNWVGSSLLQSSTNLAVPAFVDVPGVTNGPFTNVIGSRPTFYRARSPN